MYASVQLLNGFQRSLWYTIPPHLVNTIGVGSVVLVPLQRRKETALVSQIAPALPETVSFKIKDICGLEPFPPDALYHQFVCQVAQFHFVRPMHFYQRIRHFLEEYDSEEVHTAVTSTCADSVVLTQEQQAVVDYVQPVIGSPAYVSTLIHGVTGSGKTEVYKRLIQTAIEQNKTVMLLLPEVTLALQFEHLLRKQLSGVTVVGFHSATKPSDKKALWDQLVQRKPVLIIGVHLPIMLPCANLGLIIVDEEHEQGFQEKKHPKMNSKELALWRASYYKIPIVLGSATPSLNSLYNVQHRGWKLFEITKRFAGKFPAITKVVLTQEGRRRKSFWVSRELEDGIKECLANKKQAIIFLNRRGYSFFVQCKTCGFIFQCAQCSVSLTLHRTVKDGQVQGVLRCHYCDHAIQLPTSCPSCKAPEKELLKKGIGTQQVVQIFKDLFPRARIERADLDTTKKQREWQTTVERFYHGDIDMLIGTQTITKGYHFPNVTLVGILWADLNLHFPLYNASETTLQQLIQVAGRAGRQCAEGKVIVQTMHDHPIFKYVNEIQYRDFFADELEARRETGYPPFARLASIEVRHTDATCADADAATLADRLREINQAEGLNVSILGPAFPLVYRIQRWEVRHIVLKAPSFKALHFLLSSAEQCLLNSGIFVTMSQ